MDPSDLDNNIQKFLEASTSIDVDGLTNSIFLSFKSIEPWYRVDNREVKYPPMAAVVQRIVEQAIEYSAAVTQSLKSANDAHIFASDVITLIDYTSSGNKSIQDLNSFLDSMIQFSEEACKRAIATNERFSRIRFELFQISKDISLLLEEVEERHRAGKDSDSIGVIILPNPIPLQLEDLTRRSLQIAMTSKRIMCKHSLTDIMSQLVQTQQNIQQLIHHVGDSADIWAAIERGIFSLRKTPLHVFPNKSNPQRIRSHWMQIQRTSRTYTERIQLLEDYFSGSAQRCTLMEGTSNSAYAVTGKNIPFPRSDSSFKPTVISHPYSDQSTPRHTVPTSTLLSRSSSDTVVACNRKDTAFVEHTIKGHHKISEDTAGCCIIC